MFDQGLSERFRKPKKWLWGQFRNARGAILRFGRLSTHKTPLAHIVYLEGLSEFAEKKFELARDFNKMACNFSVLDRYGQGKSARYMEDAPHKQHSDGIDHDIDDVIQYCRENIPKGEPIILLGHSTGGLIALMALEREPELFKGAILTAPLLGIKNPLVNGKEGFCATLPIPQAIQKKYIPGGTDWMARDDETSHLKADDFSSDPVRNKLNDYWAQKNEELRVGSPTIGWVQQMCIAIAKSRAAGFLEKIKQPVLVFTAGDDCLVENAPAYATVSRLQDAKHIHYPQGKHELLMETDDIRDDLLEKTHDFLKNNL